MAILALMSWAHSPPLYETEKYFLWVSAAVTQTLVRSELMVMNPVSSCGFTAVNLGQIFASLVKLGLTFIRFKEAIKINGIYGHQNFT